MKPSDSSSNQPMGTADDFRTLVECAQELIVVVRDGKVVYANPSAQQALGYPPSDIVGSDATRLVHPGDRESLADRWQQALHGTPLAPAPRRLIRRDGSILWISGGGFAARFGGTLALVLLGRDLTDERLAETERQRAAALSTIGALVAGLAPELRNPMFSISAAVDSFVASAYDQPAAEALAKGVRYEMGRLSQLLSKLAELGAIARASSPDSRLQQVVGAVIQSVLESAADSDSTGAKR